MLFEFPEKKSDAFLSNYMYIQLVVLLNSNDDDGEDDNNNNTRDEFLSFFLFVLKGRWLFESDNMYGCK